ncbi:MAG: hypothetical protein ABI995_02685, partial [Acidobacteriota bacterium]
AMAACEPSSVTLEITDRGVSQAEIAKDVERRLVEQEKSVEDYRLAQERAAEDALEALRAKKQELIALEARERALLATLPTIFNTMTAVFVAADIKCHQDYLAAVALGGLEQRKRLVDLVTYGCGFIADESAHVAVIGQQGTYSRVSIVNGQNSGKTGWVPSAWIKPATAAPKAPAAKGKRV